jgi:16S rRNA (guanine(1405)-N(7))-methyltransferase
MRSASFDRAQVIARVAVSRRYRWVAEAVVERLADEELPKARNLADAEKRVKRRLHQIFGAYTGQADYSRLLLTLATAHASGEPEQLRADCRVAMAEHASTRERLPILDAFYDRIFAITGPPSSIVDIACGLNPLAVPWMGLPAGAHYSAYDIDRGLVELADGFLDLLDLPGTRALRDVVDDPPDEACDIALLLKSIPCIDQQHPDASAALLRSVGARARWLVISFPTQSLGGHGKGMARTYQARFDTLSDELGWSDVTRIELPGELVFVVGPGWETRHDR